MATQNTKKLPKILVSKFIFICKAVGLRIDCFFLTKISDWSDEMNDVFKDMQVKVGCDYLSDLPSYKRKVWQEMKRLNPANYEERQFGEILGQISRICWKQLIHICSCRNKSRNCLIWVAD